MTVVKFDLYIVPAQHLACVACLLQSAICIPQFTHIYNVKSSEVQSDSSSTQYYSCTAQVLLLKIVFESQCAYSWNRMAI